jgi:uncharacterized protein with PQ loop repeat
MNIGYHHYHYRKKHTEGLVVEENKLKFVIDHLVYAFSVLAVFVLLPQALEIWIGQNASGVSLITWVGILLGSLFWLSYGLIHKEKPIIIANFAIALMDFLIVLGILIYG